ncbi:DUF6583 family protein [Thalassobacillus pellis]|uniref:DUF6583 family protein n=1 Tax=Thalassobacillus pellis TaxID=748008 RepID=UPI0019610080|nr:DUF6583 family protein [Thalassobacillus pellis]MBM7551184.1 hypothetical protein [Thalassobacillus pellis]
MRSEKGTSPAAKKRFSGVKSWVFVIVTVVLVAGIGATAFGMLKNNNPMARYLSAEKNTLEKQMNLMDEFSGDMEEVQEKMLKEAFKTESTIKADVDITEGGQNLGAMLPMIQGLISSAQLETTQMLDPETKDTFMAFDLLLQGQSLGNAEIYQTDEKTAVKVPFLYEKYFSLQNNKLGELLARSGQPVDMNEIPNLAEYQTSGLTAEEAEEIVSDYAIALVKELESDQFALEKGVNFEGKELDKVTVTLSEEEAKDLITVLVEKMKKDERIWKLFENQLSFNLPEGQAENAVKEGKSSLDELIAGIDQLQLPEGVKLTAYLDGDLVVNREIAFDIKPAKDVPTASVALHTSYAEEDKNSYTSTIDMSVKQEGEKSSFHVNYQENGKKKEEKWNIEQDIAFKLTETGESSTVSVALSSILAEGNTETTFDVNLEGDAFAGLPVPEIGGYLNTETKTEKETVNRQVVLGLDLGMKDPMIGPVAGTVEFQVDTATTFTSDFDFPELAAENTVNLAETSDQELESIMKEIENNVQEYYMNMFGSFGGLGSF